MAKSHPAPLVAVSRSAQWARNTVASIILLTCLISLSIVLHSPYGRLADVVAHGLAARNATQPVPEAEVVPVIVDPNTNKYRAIGEYLARRYRVSSEITINIVAKAHDVGQEFKLDPMLILAVIAVESRFNPIAESAMGAKGLMQVIPRYHPDKFDPLGGEKVAFDTRANITVGARILKDYIRRTGDIGDALQMYVGATTDESGNGYSAKVIFERDRLNQMLRQFGTQARPQPQPVGRSLASAI